MVVKVIVEYQLEDMIDEESLKTEFNNDVKAAYDFVSDGTDHPLNFTDTWKVISVEVLKPSTLK